MAVVVFVILIAVVVFHRGGLQNWVVFFPVMVMVVVVLVIQGIEAFFTVIVESFL